MPFAIDIPPFTCLLRRQFLYNCEDHLDEVEPVQVIGCDSIDSRAVGFDVLLENGALFSRLPISALCWKETKLRTHLNFLQPWGAFSYDVESHVYSALRECPVVAAIGNIQINGSYMFTLSWKGSQYAEDAQHFKRGHFIRLEHGEFALLPNNRILWKDKAWVTKPFNAVKPDYKTNTHNWVTEQ